jgi:hypothetical protein
MNAGHSNPECHSPAGDQVANNVRDQLIEIGARGGLFAGDPGPIRRCRS